MGRVLRPAEGTARLQRVPPPAPPSWFPAPKPAPTDPSPLSPLGERGRPPFLYFCAFRRSRGRQNRLRDVLWAVLRV